MDRLARYLPDGMEGWSVVPHRPLDPMSTRMATVDVAGPRAAALDLDAAQILSC